jgi:HAD superfamily hydrolase (TIGR01490 family)
MVAAIFDLDGTLYTGHIWRGVWLHHRTHRVNRRWLYFYIGSHMSMWPLWRTGLLSEASGRDLWARNMGWTMRGLTLETADAAFAWIAEHYVLPRMRREVPARLRAHQTSGHRVILVSGTPSPLLTEIGRRLGVEETVGTPLVIRRGRYTGSCEPPACQGANKVARLEEYLQDTSEVDWAHSWAYADSYTDIPLLERVGNPVAVYPDEQLAAQARSRGWEIIPEAPVD